MAAARNLLDISSRTYLRYAPQMFANTRFSCHAGMLGQLAQSNSSLSDNGILIATDVRCIPCGSSVFNVGVQTITMVNSTADRMQTRGCLPCPVGARFNCSGSSVGASRRFWAHWPATIDENTTFAFLTCPHHYCCESDDGCDAVDFCSGNRTGVLCGACRDGFTHALSASAACVEATLCSPATSTAAPTACCATFRALAWSRTSST